MNTIDKLISASSSKDTLTAFLKQELNAVYDLLLTTNYDELKQERQRLETYINQYLKIIKKLDFNITEVKVFVTLLLEISERFGFLMPFQRLFKILQKNQCEISYRLQAASLYLIKIKTIDDYKARLNNILQALDKALSEEDNSNRIITTLLNYYASVIRDFGKYNSNSVLEIKDSLSSDDNKQLYPFLNHELITTALTHDVHTNEQTYDIIQTSLDEFLSEKQHYRHYIGDDILLETKTDYDKSLKSIEPNFYAIRNLCSRAFYDLDDDSVFYTLGRGVEILKEEKQLYSYLHSYGNMHYHKMMSSFDFLPPNVFENDISVIDWGCGQALASICLLEYLNNNGYNDIVRDITLIEPSEIALKRGALHVLKYNPTVGLKTINTDFNSLKKEYFNNSNQTINVHLFSNIIDVDKFSLNDLLSLIDNTFDGVNYFVCVSPHINFMKTNRLNQFMNYFSDKDDFQIIKEIDNRQKYEWKSDKKWTRVVRVFKVKI